MGELLSKYRPEESGKKEAIEIPLSRRAWLGGAFSVGGSIYFSIVRKSATRNSAIPRMEISESDPTFPRKLSEELGGTFRPRPNIKTFTWTLSYHRASHVAISMSLFVPSRQRVISQLKEFERITNPRERVNLVREFRKEEPIQSHSTEDYIRLLDIPEFVAGIIDARGIVYSFRNSTSQSELRVQTTDDPLIDALIRKFGGTRYLAIPKGSKFTSFTGKNYISRKDNQCWMLGMKGTAELYQYVKPHLLGNGIKGYNPPNK
jgi:hypothetical protein